ncbi:hypothetical protein FGG08_000895 [Glutinoglossum americanum]|uniref:Protein MON2 homolog n=1 Tax=Glutinoglossum americanum TaxID=1670608 RepID=A0A9P8I7X7_9PEZI|nr:hypothetical protein FGG08_000895 [Glutinoglossum americanum]
MFAADRSLNDLKAIPTSSEAQVAADLSQRPNFLDPFLIACGTRNTKFTGIAVVCLQRLIVSRGLSKARLKEVLEAFREATSLGLDIQLKILQALPSLLQNYADDLRGELLGSALLICSILQSSKTGVVNNTAAATLQQLFVSVFDKVVTEDERALELPTVGEAPAEDGPVQLRSSALDAYRVCAFLMPARYQPLTTHVKAFNDLCLLTERQKPQFLRFTAMPQTFGLELIESILTNHADIFLSHPEQANVLRVRVMPFVIRSLSERLNFPTAVRVTRVLYVMLRRHLTILSSECEMALGLLTHMLDPDAAPPWKRALCMEVFRGIYAEPGLTRKIYSQYDEQEGKKSILKNHVAALVRLATEKPAVIGLGHQSTIPGAQSTSGDPFGEQAAMEAAGVGGMIGGGGGMNELGVPGISTQWSSVRVPCIDQLDKTEPPTLPESYIYSLVLTCINNFSEGLAKFILPLTIPTEGRAKRRNRTPVNLEQDGALAPITETGPSPHSTSPEPGRKRSAKRSQVPVNPLTLDALPLFSEVKTTAAMVENCWPAILAACSTFLNAALDSEFYHSLVRSFQKFTHVAGLLRLDTPRDTFLTTLGKAAVPSNVLSANAGASPSTPAAETQSIFKNAKGLLTVDAFVSHSPTTTIERSQQTALDANTSTLTTRNLLCLRALLNLGIALGPTLGSAWSIILETLQQAEYVIFASSRKVGRQNSYPQKGEGQGAGDAPSLQANFGAEITAVETAASRMFESTSDFPNESFIDVLVALCKLLGNPNASARGEESGSPITPLAFPRMSQAHRRLPSISGVSTSTSSQLQEDHFGLAKLGELASINMSRLIFNGPDASGWDILIQELVSVACSTCASASVRLKSAEVLTTVVMEAAMTTTSEPTGIRADVQQRVLSALRAEICGLGEEVLEASVAAQGAGIEVHRIALDALKSVLEQSGEALVSGWDIVFDIMTSVFGGETPPSPAASLRESAPPSILRRASKGRSPKLIRSSFSSLQLICSDFLSSLPTSCILVLVDTLFEFCSQDDDLNISLTTITFFWNVSDYLQGRIASFSLEQSVSEAKDERDLLTLVANDDERDSNAALWMLLLLRLAAVTTDLRAEVRNGAVQTLLRIFDAYGDLLSPQAWSLCLKTVIFKMINANNVQHTRLETELEKRSWNETTIIILNGVAGLYANYLDTFTQQVDFTNSWETLIRHLITLLDRQSLDVNAAIFRVLGMVLAKVDHVNKVGKPSIELAWGLWSGRGIPVVPGTATSPKSNIQDTLLSYVRSFREIYRLIEQDIDASRVECILGLLRDCILFPDSPTYSADVEYLTPLQKQVIDTVKLIRTDIEGVPSAIIRTVADFTTLAFKQHSPSHNIDAIPGQGKRLTYIALSIASMSLLQSLILLHVDDKEVYCSGAFRLSLDALIVPIVLKYGFSREVRGSSPWVVATSTSLAILEPAMNSVRQLLIGDKELRQIWKRIVTIAGAIAAADCSQATENSNILFDQESDINSFLRIRDLITPALGSAVVADKTRRAYAESIFINSFVHEPESDELSDPGGEILKELYNSRPGQTFDHQPQQRIKLAQAASPYLILRAGLTLRAYISDQPLRGRMPQPLSQRKELLYIIQRLTSLDSEPRSIPDATGVISEHKKHLHRLFPLISRAVAVTKGDQDLLKCLATALDVIGGEFGIYNAERVSVYK